MLDGWPPDKEKLERLLDQGETMASIARAYGVPWIRVKRLAEEYGIASSRQKLRAAGWPPDREALDRMLNQEYLSYGEIAKMYGVTNGAVRYWMKAYGIKRTPGAVEGEKARRGDKVREALWGKKRKYEGRRIPPHLRDAFVTFVMDVMKGMHKREMRKRRRTEGGDAPAKASDRFTRNRQDSEIGPNEALRRRGVQAQMETAVNLTIPQSEW